MWVLAFRKRLTKYQEERSECWNMGCEYLKTEIPEYLNTWILKYKKLITAEYMEERKNYSREDFSRQEKLNALQNALLCSNIDLDEVLDNIDAMTKKKILE